MLTNNGSGGFATASTPSVGAEPAMVTAADVNGDGQADLISANFTASTLSVLTNRGSGLFTLASTPSVGSGPLSVTSADVNGDGKPDLISANYSANTLTVLTNHGSGGFGLASSPAVGSSPYSVTSADVNGDGRPDLISANLIANTLTVLTNSGGGGFVLASLPGVGGSPRSVTAADVNGDGRPDLISANFTANTLSVLTNTGSGFGLASLPGVGGNPVAVTAADVNGDGKPDLISANINDNTLSVLFNAPTFNGRFAGNGSGLTSLDAASLTTGVIDGARLPWNIALVDDFNIFYGRNAFKTNVVITGNGSLAFDTSGDATTRQMIDLYQTAYGIGVQNFAAYFRSDSDFIWYRGGLHRDAYGDGGPGSAKLMTLGSTGNLEIAGTLSQGSDRNIKQSFAPVNPQEVLAKVAALPIQTWTYTNDPAVRHVGPVAQDFHAAFGLNGTDDKHITTVDESGVALAAIQGLNQKVEERDIRIRELEQRLEKLERLINRQSGGAR